MRRLPTSTRPAALHFAFAGGVALALAACGGAQERPIAGDLLQEARRSAVVGIRHPARLTDGLAAVEGDPWLTNLASRLTSERSQITFDLGAEKPLGCAMVQGDNNDSYALLGSADGATFTTLWIAGPAPGAGMRLRQGQFAGSARYLRLEASGGDSLYAVTELAVFATCPATWPGVELARAAGVPSYPAAHESLLLLAIAGSAFLLLHRRKGPRWIGLLAVVPIAAALHAAVALAEIYPFPNTDEESLVRAVVALLAGLLVVKETFLPERFAPEPAVSRVTLGILALSAVACYYHFGAAQFLDAAKGRPSIVHTWDMRNYFPTVKYFDELRYDGVYLASLAAYVDVVGKGDPASVRNVALRDLTDYHMMNGVEAASRLDGIRARFSPGRWAEFKQDMKYFIDAMGPAGYLGSMRDHGGNATPVWLLSAWLIYRDLPANEWTLGAAGFIDPLLLLLFFVVLARTFGLRVMLYTVILFGATDFYQFGSNLMGSTLRQDWLVALGLGACALKKDRPFLGGFLLAYAGLIRAFPALAALFLVVPVVLWIAAEVVNLHRMPSWRALVAAQGQALRAIAGAAVAVVGLVLLTSGVFGYNAAWKTWLTKIEMHAVGPSTNNVGLRNLLAYRPADSLRALGQRRAANPFEEWDRGQVTHYRELRPLFYALNALALGLLILGVARRPLHQVTLLGLLLVPFLFYPSNYYCHFVFLLPMAVSAGRRDSPAGGPPEERERLFGLVVVVLAAISVGQYFTLRAGGADERYTLQSALLLAGFALLIGVLAVEGRRALFAAGVRRAT